MRKQAVSLRPVATSSAGGLGVQKFWDLQRSSTLVGKRGILRVPCFQEPTYFGLFIGFQCPHCSFCGLTAMSILYLGPIYSAEEKNAAKQRPFNNVNTRERLGIIGIVNEGAVYLKRTYAQHDFRDAILQKTLNCVHIPWWKQPKPQAHRTWKLLASHASFNKKYNVAGSLPYSTWGFFANHHKACISECRTSVLNLRGTIGTLASILKTSAWLSAHSHP